MLEEQYERLLGKTRKSKDDPQFQQNEEEIPDAKKELKVGQQASTAGQTMNRSVRSKFGAQRLLSEDYEDDEAKASLIV